MENTDQPKKQPSTTSSQSLHDRIERLKKQRDDKSQKMVDRVIAGATLLHWTMPENLKLSNPSPEKRNLS